MCAKFCGRYRRKFYYRNREYNININRVMLWFSAQKVGTFGVIIALAKVFGLTYCSLHQGRSAVAVA